MTRHQLIARNLLHYWRTNFAVLLGVVAGTAVIGGALIIGDSVRASLRRMTLERLGRIDYIVSGPRFFRQDLAQDLKQTEPFQNDSFAAPAIVMQAGLQAKSSGASRRAGNVFIYGFDEQAWNLVPTSIARPQGSSVVLSALAAKELNVKVNDNVTLWIELPSAVPRDTLLGRKDNDSQEVTLTVAAISSDEDALSRLGFNPTQAFPLNAFVDLSTLQERLDLDEVKPSHRDPTYKPARANSLLIAHPPAEAFKQAFDTARKVESGLADKWQLSDLNLRIVRPKDNPSIAILESEQMILEDRISKAALSLPNPTLPVMVYLLNKMWNPRVHTAIGVEGYSMYSTVAGLDVLDLNEKLFGKFEFVGERPTSFVEGDVILNEWLATDLQVKPGDEIKFTYHLVGSRGELPEEERTVTVRGIVKMTGAAADRSLTPEVKGITDVDSLADWDQPFDMDLKAVTARDDAYWEQYRATPKMFVPLKTAQKWWPSRYGSLTSVRIDLEPDAKSNPDSDSSALAQAILNHLKPAELGLAVQPVKAIGLMAANGSTDFSGLFFGFSLFLIVAAMILIGLLFRLGVEQRVRDLGLLGAIGFSPRQVHQQMLQEGLVIVLAGGLLGLAAAVGYAQAMIYGLTHWWVGAIGTKNLVLSVTATSLTAGFAIAVIAAVISIWWALRHLKSLSLREQLAGVTEKEADLETVQKRTRKSKRRAVICAAVAALLTLGMGIGLIPAAGAFFGVGTLLLIAGSSYLSAWLVTPASAGGHAPASSLHGKGSVALGQLGLRNAARQRVRSVMTAGMIATATFMIVAVAAMRRDPTGELPDKKSGNGGYTLVAESSTPVLYDLNTPDGRKKLQITASPDSPAAQALSEMHVVPFRVKPGEDASCLNLYQTRVPTILGVPQSLIEEGRFAFASGSWKALNTQVHNAADPIPVLGDMNTLMFSLHKNVGQTIKIPSDDQPQHELKVAGMFQDSVFQGVLVMSEENFLKLFPDQKGFRYFLIEVPPKLADTASSLLETELAEYGFDAEPVSERLARFLSVQNTYLSTFQTLGGLGLLLGTLGLATVMLRNVLERQGELALLRAIGFPTGSVGTLVLLENAFVLAWGLIVGTVSALLAVAPSLNSRGGDVPLGSLAVLLGAVFLSGMLAAAFAVRAAVALPIVATLRGE